MWGALGSLPSFPDLVPPTTSPALHAVHRGVRQGAGSDARALIQLRLPPTPRASARAGRPLGATARLPPDHLPATLPGPPP